jgi:SRSO17 transposase
MDLQMDASELRFSAYVEGLVSVIGHADRAKPLRDYCMGLMLPCERKSVEPMAAVTAPARTAAQHQSLLHFVGEGRWSDERVLAKVREMVLPRIEHHGPIEAWIIDDTGFPKQGRHSVGVARQYCGQLGKQDNCQVAVSLSLANRHASLPVAYRLYLPDEWAADAKRLRKAGVPEDVGFKTKPEIALDQIHAACKSGLPRGVVLMDAGYGANTQLRGDISALGLAYVAGILPNTTVWAPGMEPLRPKKWSGQGRPPKLIRRGGKHQPVSVKALALNLPARAWRTITWREGSAEPLSSRFARVRIRAAHRDYNLTQSRPEEWLLIEWPRGESKPTKYWLSTCAEKIAFNRLIDLAKLRWRIERDYQDLKQEVGLGHFEGRGWRGFHHHAALCIAAYGFLISERETIPPLYGAFFVKHKLSMWHPFFLNSFVSSVHGTIRGELAIWRRSSRHNLVFGGSIGIRTMMQPCASAAKLRGGGPILRNGLEGQGGIRVTATSDRVKQSTTS